MQKMVSRYDEDFVAWTEDQAGALRELGRAGTNLPLDWENLAEEVESLGRSQRGELRSRIHTIIEHLLELEMSAAVYPRAGWEDTLARERRDIEFLLETSPSLRREVTTIVDTEMSRAARFVARELQRHGEAAPDALAKLEAASFDEEQVLGDWFPADAIPASRT